MNYAEIYAEINDKIVVVINNDIVGTGFFVSKTGHIATANHVVMGNDDVKILSGNTQPNTIPAKVIKREPTLDLALLKIQGKTVTPTVELGNSSTINIGDEIVIVGFPFGKGLWGIFQPAIHRGIISCIVHIAYPNSTVKKRFQLDVMANPGNSGGPLVLNKNGKVIGILSEVIREFPVGNGILIQGKSIYTSTGIAIAIPIDDFKEMVKDISI
jgi:serine protease Do